MLRISNENLELNDNVLKLIKGLPPIIWGELQENKEWVELSDTEDKLVEEFKSDGMIHPVLSELLDTISAKIAIEADLMYYKGIEDAIQILKFLKVI